MITDNSKKTQKRTLHPLPKTHVRSCRNWSFPIWILTRQTLPKHSNREFQKLKTWVAAGLNLALLQMKFSFFRKKTFKIQKFFGMWQQKLFRFYRLQITQRNLQLTQAWPKREGESQARPIRTGRGKAKLSLKEKRVPDVEKITKFQKHPKHKWNKYTLQESCFCNSL